MLTPAESGAFWRFAETAERIGATTKRLEKAAILGEYLRSLDDADLERAARYFAGHIFPMRDQRTINFGGAALIRALVEASGAVEAHLRSRLVVRGDAGDVAEEIFSAEGAEASSRQPALRLQDIAEFLADLAATSGARGKSQMATALLRRATPREAKYLVKLLQGDLRIGLKEGAVEDALARLAGVPVGDVQRANMLLGDIGETALRARRGTLDAARMRLFQPLKFMLATPATDLSEVERQMPASGFVVEDKFDGIRAQAHVAPAGAWEDAVHGIVVDGRRVALFSRTLDDITGSFPDLISALAALVPPEAAAGGIVLDGEIVPVAPAGKHGEMPSSLPTQILPFQALQPRLGRKALPPDLLLSSPTAFVAYDALYLDGLPLLDAPFTERRGILERLPVDGQTIRRADSIRTSDTALLDAEFAAARQRGNEGLMVKDPASLYKPGRRGRDWLKIKRTDAVLDVVVTTAQVGEGRRSRFLSDYTFAVRASETDPALLNVGKAYSGLTDAEIQELSDWFLAHTVAEFAHGKVRLVEPRIVLEVTFDRVQASNRHKSGFALRFPRILRVRWDKPPSEIDTLATVRHLAGEEDDAETEDHDKRRSDDPP